MKPRDIAQNYLASHQGVPLGTLGKKMWRENPRVWKNPSGAESALRRAAGQDLNTKRRHENTPDERSAVLDGEKLAREESQGGKMLALDSLSYRITNLDELIEHTGIDLDVWYIDRHVVNKWEVGAKDGDNDLNVRPLFQVKAWLKRRTPQRQLLKMSDAMLKEFSKRGKKKGHLRAASKVNKGTLLEMALFDVHVGKLCWAAETGQDYDSKIAQREYGRAVESFLMRAGGPEQILFPIGNDFMNSDNSRGETTAGTRQDEDSRWQRSFAVAQGCLVDAIDKASEIAPVNVVVVSGNHDTERMFYLGQVIQAWFRNNKRVLVNNEPTLRKAFQWGNNFLGFTHGNQEKHLDLPLIFANDYPDIWGQTTHREIHLGHFHQSNEKVFNMLADRGGVRQRLISSLAATDAWHKSKGYNGIRAAEAFIFHTLGGCETHLTYTPRG